MTVAILWLIRFIIAYWIIRIILLTIRGKSAKKKPEPVRRFDSEGKNISDAEFKDMR
jgi:hypothetical protein